MKKVLGITMICSALLLSACQSNTVKEAKTQQSTSQKSVKKVKVKKAKSSKHSESTSSTSEQMSETMTETIVSESSEQETEMSASSETVEQAEGMNLSSLQANDYSSVAGTWQNGEGYTLVFDANGIVKEDTYINRFNNATIENNILKTGVAEGHYGYAIEFLPAGSSETNDASDTTKDRIWTGHQANFSNPAAFYYKVD